MHQEPAQGRRIMSHHHSATESLASNLRVFTLLLLSLFATEFAVMGLMSAMLPQLEPLLAGLIDASLLTLFLAWPFWFFVSRALAGLSEVDDQGAARLILPLWLKVLAVIFVAEFLVMLLQPLLLNAGSDYQRDLLDAFFATALSAPLLWHLLFRQEMRRCRASMTDLLGTPFGLYVLLLYMIFVADLLLDHLLPMFFPDPQQVSHRISDSIATTLLLAPLLWLFVARPLRQAILTEHARVRAVHSQLIDAIVSVDAAGTISSFNPAAERIFGYTAAEVVGRPADLLLAAGQDDLAMLLRRTATREDRIGLPPVYVVAGQCRDGRVATMEVSLSRVLQEGQREYLLVMRDISERTTMEMALRDSKERFRQIVEQSEDAILFFKPASLQLLDVNSTAETLFGLDRRQLCSDGLQTLFPAEDFARLSSAVRDAVRGEVFQLDGLNFRRGGTEEGIISLRGKIMTLQGIDLVYCTGRDITERTRLERETREIQSQLIQANKMTSLGLLVSGVAHEINNPNNFIQANAQLLARAWDDAAPILREHQRENGDFCIGGIPFSEMEGHSTQLFAGILDGSRRINAIVNELKGFARQDQETNTHPVDVNQVAGAAVSILRHELTRHTEHFHLELAAELPTVWGNGQHLGQVIVNLLMNASQALSDRHSGIWLSTGYDAVADQVVVTVRDEGCGIPYEVGLRIMDPFFTTKLDNGGTGLGLSISKSIVKEHHGSLDFASEPGRGTSFVVRLPAGRSPQTGVLS